MNKISKIKLIVLVMVICLFIVPNLHARSQSENYKISSHVLDGFGGRTSSASFSQRIGSGGQPVTARASTSTNFEELPGYISTATFVHGDANADGDVTISDVVYLVNYLFKDGPEPIPLETGDVNGNNEATIADAVYLVNYLFKDGDPPVNL